VTAKNVTIDYSLQKESLEPHFNPFGGGIERALGPSEILGGLLIWNSFYH
jgi:hypothetical protein